MEGTNTNDNAAKSRGGRGRGGRGRGSGRGVGGGRGRGSRGGRSGSGGGGTTAADISSPDPGLSWEKCDINNQSQSSKLHDDEYGASGSRGGGRGGRGRGSRGRGNSNSRGGSKGRGRGGLGGKQQKNDNIVDGDSENPAAEPVDDSDVVEAMTTKRGGSSGKSKPCRYGAKCRTKNCKFVHTSPSTTTPDGNDVVANADDPSAPTTVGKSKRHCRYKANCRTKNCKFVHPPPSLTNPDGDKDVDVDVVVADDSTNVPPTEAPGLVSEILPLSNHVSSNNNGIVVPSSSHHNHPAIVANLDTHLSLESREHNSDTNAMFDIDDDDDEEDHIAKMVAAHLLVDEDDDDDDDDTEEEEEYDEEEKKTSAEEEMRDEERPLLYPGGPARRHQHQQDEGEESEEMKKSTSIADELNKLKAQEVSISSSTKVIVNRSSSNQNLTNGDNSNTRESAGPEKVLATKKKKGKKKKGKLSKNDAENIRAARRFNRSVRVCVERSDPASLREILRNKDNHHFALDSHVLETVMKAYVVAAMFEDALYCLRNCTLPSTLSTVQLEGILQCLPQNLRNSNAYTAADMIDALCIATEFEEPSSRTYFMRIARGIALEFLEEATSARERICSASCERLVRSAHCVVNARLRRGKKPTDLVIQPGDQLGVFIPDTNENRGIQAGDAVSILPFSGPYPMSAESLDRNMIEASVTNAKPLVIRLQDKGNSELFQMLTEPGEGNVYRIDKLANRMGFNRQLAAAVSFVKPRIPEQMSQYMVDKRRPSPELVKAVTAMDENIDQMMLSGKNNAAQLRTLSSTAAICSQAVSWRLPGESICDDSNESEQQQIRDESRLALERYGALEGLNSSQRLAVMGAASNRLTLVQGPPGTGKTAVAIRVIQHWAKLAMACAPFGETPPPILATSDSNIAVDNLVEGCANVGLRVVRLGRPEAIRPELLQYCVDRPADARGGRSSGGFNNGGVYGGGMSASMYKEKARILKQAQVVCCTCIGSGGDMLDGMTFERVLVDEATQATEPAVLVPLVRGCRQLVLVGDHCQLPPTVLSTRAEEEGLGVPLFSRMVACGVPPFMLDTQYRMHPGISMFPSDLFYGGKLNDGVTPPERRPLAGFPWPREEFPVAFVPIVDSAEIDDGASKSNEAEASEVCHAVALLLSGGQCTVSDIAVVTPYSAQVRLIRRKLKDVMPKGPPFVEVASTDGFQGREKEAVVFSAVRSNSYGAVGFVSDWRRINVSFTRARRALIVIGNPDTLCRGDPDTMGAWVQWADAMGVNISNPGKSRGRYDPEVLRKVRAGTTAAEMLKDVLECQQAQLKSAEKRQARAEKNAAGHIMGNENEGQENTGVDPQALKDDLAMLEKADGCWDDSDDDDDHGMKHVSPLDHGSSTSASKDEKAVDEQLDAWDL